DQAPAEVRALFEKWQEQLAELESGADADIRELVSDIEIVQHMVKVKGVGLLLAAKVVSMVDIRRASTVSALWKFSGYGMGGYWTSADGKVIAPKVGHQWKKNKDGSKEKVHVVPEPKEGWRLALVRDRRVPDWCACYNLRLKTACYLVAKSFMLTSSPYRAVY